MHSYSPGGAPHMSSVACRAAASIALYPAGPPHLLCGLPSTEPARSCKYMQVKN